MYTIIPILFLTILSCSKANKMCEMCKLPQSNASKDLLKKFCLVNGTLTGRCCYDKYNSTIGVDWSNCNLTSLPEIEEKNKYVIQWVAINGNKNITVNDGELRFYRALETLLLPGNELCSNHTFKHSERKNDATVCTNAVTGCSGVKCPSNSHCADDGPGLSMCLCNDGWHSYRCLKKDGFPAVQWIAGFSVSTILICVSLKVAQRKSIARMQGSQ